ncbi:hypothetical protein ACS0TY_033828 [Phlomoides rotata]
METSIGMVIRDEDVVFVAAHTMVTPGLMTVEEREAWGVVKEMRWARNLGYSRVEFETDAKWVCDALISFEKMNTPFGDFIWKRKERLSENYVCY